MSPAKIRKQLYRKKRLSLALLEISLATCVLVGSTFVASASLNALQAAPEKLRDSQS